jgi:hypothetical protein
MTTKKTERIMYYDEKERRWITETMELDDEEMNMSQSSDENNDKSEKRMVY